MKKVSKNCYRKYQNVAKTLVNLEDFDYDTGFNTDLHQIAIDVMNNHPSSYKFNNE